MDLGFGKILDKMYCEQAQFFVKLQILGYILEMLFYYFIEVILSFTNVNGVTYIKRHLVDNKKYSAFTYVWVFTINFYCRTKDTTPI